MTYDNYIIICVAVFCFFEVVHGKKLNVLLIIADDLRPTLGCYQSVDDRSLPFVTPNIDQLASHGVLFTKAYAQPCCMLLKIALCGPSRTSFLTGRRPESVRTFDNTHGYWRKFAGNFTTIPQYFKNHGYHTVSAGKIFHPGKLSGGTDDWPFSWSQEPFHPSTQQYKNAKVCENGPNPENDIVCPVNLTSQPEQTLPDIQTAVYAIERLRNFSITNQPFFLAVGFHKPHIPLKYPEQFKALYEWDKVTPAENDQIPRKLPKIAYNPWSDMRKRHDISSLNLTFPYEQMPRLYQRKIRQSYFAAVSYIDVLLGRILATLDGANLTKNTVVAFTSDHGWSLGEHGEWSKYSNLAVALRIPLIVYIPGITSRKSENLFPYKDSLNEDNDFRIPNSIRISELTELVDLFPSLVEAAGLENPQICPVHNPSNACVEGSSFVSLIEASTQLPPAKYRWKSAAFAQYPRPSLLPQLNSDQPKYRNIRYMGYAIITEEYHYVEWVDYRPKTQSKPQWSKLRAKELYLLKSDCAENQNVADNITFANVVHRLSARLHKGWRYANRKPRIKQQESFLCVLLRTSVPKFVAGVKKFLLNMRSVLLGQKAVH